MNFVVVASAAVPVSVLHGGYLYYFYPVVDTGAGGAVACGDVNGNPITLEDWVKGHKDANEVFRLVGYGPGWRCRSLPSAVLCRDQEWPSSNVGVHGLHRS